MLLSRTLEKTISALLSTHYTYTHGEPVNSLTTVCMEENLTSTPPTPLQKQEGGKEKKTLIRASADGRM